MKKGTLFFVMALFFLLLSYHGVLADHLKVFRVSDGKVISFEEMIGDIKDTDIILTGELHDSRLHHQLQLDAIRDLTDSGRPVAVGLEMFPKERQPALDGWIAGSLSEEDFKKIYQESWTQPWSLYQDIFLFARDNKIPLVALNVPRDITQKVKKSGFLSLTDEELKKLPPGLGCNVDDQYMEFIRSAFMAHKKSDKEFQYFCEMQLLWDKSMAWYLLEYMKKDPGKTVVVLTGLNHAWKKGIPVQIRQFSEKSGYKVLLPEVSGIIGPGNMTVQDADYILLQ